MGEAVQLPDFVSVQTLDKHTVRTFINVVLQTQMVL